MQNGWQQIYFSDRVHLIEIVKALLTENNISSFEVDRNDSTHITMSGIELYVKDTDVMRAKFLIEQHNL